MDSLSPSSPNLDTNLLSQLEAALRGALQTSSSSPEPISSTPTSTELSSLLTLMSPSDSNRSNADLTLAFGKLALLMTSQLKLAQEQNQMLQNKLQNKSDRFQSNPQTSDDESLSSEQDKSENLLHENQILKGENDALRHEVRYIKEDFTDVNNLLKEQTLKHEANVQTLSITNRELTALKDENSMLTHIRENYLLRIDSLERQIRNAETECRHARLLQHQAEMESPKPPDPVKLWDDTSHPKPKDLDRIARNLSRFEPNLDDPGEIHAYLNDLKFFLERFPNASSRDKIYVIKASSSKQVSLFIDRQPLDIRDDFEALCKILIEEYCNKNEFETGYFAAHSITQAANERPGQYYNRLLKVYFGPKNEPMMEEEQFFKELFFKNLHSSTSRHLHAAVDPKKLSSRELRSFASRAFMLNDQSHRELVHQEVYAFDTRPPDDDLINDNETSSPFVLSEKDPQLVPHGGHELQGTREHSITSVDAHIQTKGGEKVKQLLNSCTNTSLTPVLCLSSARINEQLAVP
uniref:Uncharacterized protein n=1 Tax=Gouania willdenowi TaxID=441366 RepID=A0A8C5I849_GOUWI